VPPWDATVAVDDPLVGWLAAAGFQPYRQMATVVCSLDGLRPASHVAGVSVEKYRNQMADAFQEAEREALADSPSFRELGQPTGYEGAEGFDAFLVARKGERIVGFAQAQLPEGWINWMGVVPDQRRHGIGRALVAAVAKAVANSRGTHIGMETDETPEALAFWRSLGFRTTGRQVALIRRTA
jgi:GNAT superfamily N-acetyltransferase